MGAVTPLAEPESEFNPLDGLSFQQETFVLAYMANGANATAAAREAGYSYPDTQAYRVVGTPRIKAAIEHLRAERRAAVDMELRQRHITPDRIVEELSIVAGFDLSQVLVQTPDGPKLDLSRLGEHDARALAQVETERTGGKTTKVKIKAHDKLAALRLLMDHFGMLKQSQVNIQVNVGFAERMAARRNRALEDR